MVTHNVPPETFRPHGKVSLNVENGVLHMTTNTALRTQFVHSDTPIQSYVYLPNKYKLPFKIDMTVKIDSPAFYLLIGKGHVGFATGMDNRKVTDILGGDFKPNTHSFDNDLPLNQFVDITVTYDTKAMWICIDNELRCISRKDPYIKAAKKGDIPEEFAAGFDFALACDKRTQMEVQSFTVTEYATGEIIEPQEGITKIPHPPCLSSAEKPTIGECIQDLSQDLQNEILQTDEYLLKDMKKALGFKRKIEGGYPYSKISYVSPVGLSYKIHITGFTLQHQINWIRYNTQREQEKYGHQKADLTNETLAKLSGESPEFAEEIFYRIRECFGCQQECQYRVIYELGGKKKVSCTDICSGIHFKMRRSDFEDLRKVMKAISDVVSAGSL